MNGKNFRKKRVVKNNRNNNPARLEGLEFWECENLKEQLRELGPIPNLQFKFQTPGHRVPK